MIRFLLTSLTLSSAALAVGPYPPAAGQAGSTAIHKDDSRFVAWASGTWAPNYGNNVDAQWRTPAKALGKALGDSYDILCLGNGGSVTLWFPNPICNKTGDDFAVFENSFSDGFLELAFVEVSSDGVNFIRFPSASLGTTPLGGFANNMDPTNLDGLAGKYRQGYGTPFDLAALPASPLLDKQNVRFVRIVDIIGDGSAKDSSGRSIFDPTPTVGSGGFDLDAIGVIHQNDGAFRMLESGIVANAFVVQWESNPGNTYRVETSTWLGGWAPVETLPGSATTGFIKKTYSLPNDTSRFWRVVRTN